GLRMRLEAVDSCGWKLLVKEENGRTNVASYVQDQLWLQRSRKVILSFLTSPQQHLVNGQRIGSRRTVRNVVTSPAQLCQRLSTNTGESEGASASRVGRKSEGSRPGQDPEIMPNSH